MKGMHVSSIHCKVYNSNKKPNSNCRNNKNLIFLLPLVFIYYISVCFNHGLFLILTSVFTPRVAGAVDFLVSYREQLVKPTNLGI